MPLTDLGGDLHEALIDGETREGLHLLTFVSRKQSTLMELFAGLRSAADLGNGTIAERAQTPARVARAILALCNLTEIIADQLVD